jgi:uncharacterized protein (DUF427 family)
MQAVWKNVILAESNDTVIVEGNHYFPPAAVSLQYLRPSDTHTACPWKGLASYYHIDVDGELNKDAAWYYPDPKDAAKNIKAYVAFWKGVQVKD